LSISQPRDTSLPADLSTARWWLWEELSNWILFSYDLKKMYVGPAGVERRWAEKCDYTAFYDDWDAGMRPILEGPRRGQMY
jgi:hypothetical protein